MQVGRAASAPLQPRTRCRPLLCQLCSRCCSTSERVKHWWWRWCGDDVDVESTIHVTVLQGCSHVSQASAGCPVLNHWNQLGRRRFERFGGHKRQRSTSRSSSGAAAAAGHSSAAPRINARFSHCRRRLSRHRGPSPPNPLPSSFGSTVNSRYSTSHSG